MNVLPTLRPSEPVFALFGSVTTGCQTVDSDFDVLCIALDSRNVEPGLASLIEESFGQETSLSIYSWRRIDELWASGSPFAWHLWLEARPLSGFASAMEYWENPSPYLRAREDIQGTHRILASSTRATHSEISEGDTIFEAGVVASCLRNAAIFASIVLAGRWAFGQFAPYQLGEFSLPMCQSQYAALVKARFSSRRGGTPPGIKVGELKDAQRVSIKWIEDLLEKIE